MNYLESFNTTIRIININMNDDLQVGISHYLGYSRKIQTGGVEGILFWKNPWNFSFFYFTLGNSRQNKA